MKIITDAWATVLALVTKGFLVNIFSAMTT
ncbi:uncharacterized protein METZ01_LOCUS49496 [marine metagenome]|uniref:Uncharacterized protein n=1 Tax=marine metagenome TaxID=408172 RepID=A0A381RXS6_9ZZZZ